MAVKKKVEVADVPVKKVVVNPPELSAPETETGTDIYPSNYEVPTPEKGVVYIRAARENGEGVCLPHPKSPDRKFDLTFHISPDTGGWVKVAVSDLLNDPQERLLRELRLAAACSPQHIEVRGDLPKTKVEVEAQRVA